MFDWSLMMAVVLAVPADPPPDPGIAPISINETTSLVGPAPLSATEVTALPEDLRQRLAQEVTQLGGSERQRLDRMLAIALDAGGRGLEYDLSRTRTVADTWLEGKANCVSFALLIVAMAREVGLQAQVRELGEVVAFYQEAGAIYNVDHINVQVRVGGESRIVDMDRSLKLGRQAPRLIDDARALAHFHNNRGVEAMASGAVGQAQGELKQALSLAPDFVPAWNNLGVLQQRSGLLQASEASLLAAYALVPEQTATLRNLANHYLRRDLPESAAPYLARLERLSRLDPFHRFGQGLECERRGDDACALRHYRQAIRLQPDQHLFHFGLARVQLKAGQLSSAHRQLLRAAHVAGTPPLRDFYLAQARALQAPSFEAPGLANAR